MEPVGVLVVDDQLPFRVAAKAVVAATQGFVVVGEADDGDGVIDAVEQHRPSLVLMDVKMTRVDGIEATRRLLETSPETTVFLCSTYPLAELPDDALTCGARGYLQKEQLSTESLRAVWARRDEGGLVTL